MSQKNKIQDGIVTYSAANPLDLLKFNVNGQLNVSDKLTIGKNSLVNGIITSPSSVNINVEPGSGANLSLFPGALGGRIRLNNVQWPSGNASPNAGHYLGSSSLNVLEFYPFILAVNPSDTLTVSDLNTEYPTIQPGQSVIGPTTVYMCVAPSTWRILGAPVATTHPQTLIIRLTSNPSPASSNANYNWFPTILQTSNDSSWDVYGSQLSLDSHGWYKITITSTATRGNILDDYNWLDSSAVYGSEVTGASGPSRSQYFRGNAAFSPENSWASLPSVAQQMTWSDTFFVNVMYSSLATQIGNYLDVYSDLGPTIDVAFDLMMSVQRIENAIV